MAAEKCEAPPAAGAGSYEQKCPICLEDYQDKSFIAVCFHAFCFVCIVQWSEVTNSCPLCKVTFDTVIHNVESNTDYKIYKVNTSSESKRKAQNVSIDEARRFHYRTTFVGRQQQQFGSSHGIKQSRKPASEERRRAVYLCGFKALPVTNEARKVRIRDVSANFFKKNPAATHRLLPWLSRDIKVILGEEHVEFIIQFILSLIDKIDINSSEFRNHLQPFFNDKTEHFMHEFLSFARSPLDMIAYDNTVSYELQQNNTNTQISDTNINEGSCDRVKSPTQSDQLQQRVFDEIATCSWDDSPPLVRNVSPSLLSYSPEETNQRNEEQVVMVKHVSLSKSFGESKFHQSSSKTSEEPVSDGLVVEDSSNLLYEDGRKLSSSADVYRDSSYRYEQCSDDTPVDKHKKRKSSRRHSSSSKKHSIDTCNNKKVKHRSKHDLSHTKRKKHHSIGMNNSATSSNLFLVSSDKLSHQLQCIDSDIINAKKKLLKNMLQKERTTLLKSALHKESTSKEDLSSPFRTEMTFDENSDELVQELQEVERAIVDTKREMMAVEKRLSQELDESDEELI